MGQNYLFPEMEEMKLNNDWVERYDVVHDICDHMQLVPGTSEDGQKLMKYISDPRWEIRELVATNIAYLREEDLQYFICLINDSNSFVAEAAQQAYKRRNVNFYEEKKLERQLSRIYRKFERARKQYGDELIDTIRTEVMKAYELSMGCATHDIRNLLSPLHTGLRDMDRIAASKLGSEDFIAYNKGRAKVEVQLERLILIIDDVRMLCQKTPKQRVSENLYLLLKSSSEMVKTLFADRGQNIQGIGFDLTSVPEDIQIYVSKPEIERVFFNLLKNAAESYLVSTTEFAQSGQIEITVTQQENETVIMIKDYGMGMSQRMLKMVRMCLPWNSSKKQTGSGLGMAIAHEKIIDHDGKMTIDSIEGSGTTVTVFLPCLKEN